GGGHDGSSADSGSKDASGDAAGPGEAGVDSAAADGGGCGEFTGDTVPTCSGDGSSLGQCAGGVPNVQVCADGCLHAYGQNPASCLLPTATNFSCTGSYGTEPVDDGNYYMSSFGCWVDTSGGIQTDPGDNCIPSCLSKAIAAGLCPPGTAGPACEESINWYTADAARFGCLARLRVTNPANGKKLIAVALDYGPGCSGENKVSHAVLDSSGRVDDYLFGGPQGASDKSVVHVVQVADSTPLGPE
ncbi:MAG: hypothetical protein ACRELB_17655, partial [Polyangiaceae bacterium]